MKRCRHEASSYRELQKGFLHLVGQKRDASTTVPPLPASSNSIILIEASSSDFFNANFEFSESCGNDVSDGGNDCSDVWAVSSHM